MTRPAVRSDQQRVVITGMGVVSPLAQSIDGFRDALFTGRSAITRWKRPMDPRVCSRIGGDMSDFDLDAHIEQCGYDEELRHRMRRLLRQTPLSGRLTSAAALMAFRAAALPDHRVAEERVGHTLAGHNLSADYIVTNIGTFADEPDYIDPLFGLLALDTDVLSVTSELLAVRGPSFTIGGACASGNLAVQTGLDQLRAGRADVVLVTGAAVDLDPVTLHGWGLIEALTFHSFNDEPERASRPFDARREGFVPSVSAGAVVLETLASARRRDAPILAELLGASAASDASRLTKPNREGQARAMQFALADAQVDAASIDYVNAHATSTPLGDAVEADAIRAVLGARAREIPVNSTKSMIGHCLSAAGVVELIATVIQMRESFVHPTINQEEPDPAIDLDVVPNAGRAHTIGLALSNSFGFGGINSCVVIGAAP
jgi:3-oxoacyl-(acyl-carrier-protein) synthase